MQVEKVLEPQLAPPASSQSWRGGGVPQDFIADGVLNGSTSDMRHHFSNIHLAPGWRLTWDRLQWILQRTEETPHTGEQSTPSARWRGVSYVASTKASLLRCIQENKCTAGIANLDALPDEFQTFKKENSNG